MSRFPNLFIVGAPKSGTTSLYEYLKDHPQVFMSVVKEPNYFAPDLADPRDRMLHYPRDEKAYLSLFADAGGALRSGEASVRYLYSTVAPGLIRAASPDALIVIMLRNPIEMAHSLYLHMVAAGIEDAGSFAEALQAEEDRHRGVGIPPRMNPRLSTYSDRARYGAQLPRWLEAFGRDRVHTIVFEDFVLDPAGDFRRLLTSLGVDPDYRPSEFVAHNPAHGSSSTRLRRVLDTRPAQWLAWRGLPLVVGDRRTRQLVQSFRHSRLHRRSIQRPVIPPELRERLERELEADVALAGSLIGRDLVQRWFGRPAGSAPPAQTVRAS